MEPEGTLPRGDAPETFQQEKWKWCRRNQKRWPSVWLGTWEEKRSSNPVGQSGRGEFSPVHS